MVGWQNRCVCGRFCGLAGEHGQPWWVGPVGGGCPHADPNACLSHVTLHVGLAVVFPADVCVLMREEPLTPHSAAVVQGQHWLPPPAP